MQLIYTFITFCWLNITTICSELSNSSYSFTNLEFRIHEFCIMSTYLYFVLVSFSTGKTREKWLFWTNNRVFFSNCSNWEKFVDKLVTTSDEFDKCFELLSFIPELLIRLNQYLRPTAHVNTFLEREKNIALK